MKKKFAGAGAFLLLFVRFVFSKSTFILSFLYYALLGGADLTLDGNSLSTIFTLLAIRSIAMCFTYFVFKIVSLKFLSKRWINVKTLIGCSKFWIGVGLFILILGFVSLYQDLTDFTAADVFSISIPYIALGIKTLYFPSPKFVSLKENWDSMPENPTDTDDTDTDGYSAKDNFVYIVMSIIFICVTAWLFYTLLK